ncbi:hypothetical protein SLA2020_227840 [Shorea laevis]
MFCSSSSPLQPKNFPAAATHLRLRKPKKISDLLGLPLPCPRAAACGANFWAFSPATSSPIFRQPPYRWTRSACRKSLETKSRMGKTKGSDELEG